MNTVTIYLPDEFRLLCILSGVDPKELLQSFADAVIIPSEHFKPDVLSTLASNFISRLDMIFGRCSTSTLLFILPD